MQLHLAFKTLIFNINNSTHGLDSIYIIYRINVLIFVRPGCLLYQKKEIEKCTSWAGSLKWEINLLKEKSLHSPVIFFIKK